jgi:iron complex outermembrane receptor protein
VPGHAHEHSPGDADGVRIDLRQRRTDLQAEWHGEAGFLHGARLKLGQARYQHSEIEPDGGIGTTFANRGYDARLELLHGGHKSWSGSLGLQSSRSDFSAVGEEAFLPPNQTRNDALFVFEEVVSGPLTWQFGGRIEGARITPESGSTRREELFSGAAGLVWKFDGTHALAVSLTHTSRMPNAQELYASGPHAGTQSFELGDANLAPEDCLGLELSLRRRQGAVTGALTLFANQFDKYIFEQPTGLAAVEEDGSWVFQPAGEDVAGALPVYRYVQRQARFWGVELETLWHLHDQRDWQLDLRLAGELTRAEEDAANLPRIPAARFTTGLVWANAAWSMGADCQWTLRQDRVAPNETPSDGYALVSAHVSHVMGVGRTRWEIFLRGTNLANQEARPHTSFVKDLAPLPGRGVMAGVRLTF